MGRGPMKTIRLFGELAKRFGSTHEFDVKTPAEAVRALCVNFAGFEKTLSADGAVYRVLVDKAEISEAELGYPLSRDIQIIPVIHGAGGSPAGKIIIGATLIVASVFVAGATFGGAAGLSTFMMSVGISLTMSGVGQMLTPVPKAPEPNERPENKPSYYFNGPVNSTMQGHPVPVGYGRLIVGGSVISAGIAAEEIA